MNTEELKQKLLGGTPKMAEAKPPLGLSTGSTLLNLACSGKPNVGFLTGHYYFLVGDSNSGKTFLSLTCMAEAAKNKAFDSYRFIYDNAEDGALMDMGKFFGKAMASRLEPPRTKDGYSIFSGTVQEFYYHVDDALDKGIPFIYVLDSQDSLTSEEETKKFVEHKKAARKTKKDGEEGGEKQTGSYGDGKAKCHSQNLRRVTQQLSRSGNILIIINQTRDNIAGGPFDKKTRSGGHALRFYATLEMWSSVREKIKKNVRGAMRQIGTRCRVRIKKNRLTGMEHEAEIPIYHSCGIDDVGACVTYLLDEKYWGKSGSTIDATDFNFKGTESKLIAHIEENELEPDLKLLVQEVWDEIVEGCKVGRKQRYE